MTSSEANPAYAVLMGDIVGSERVPSVQRLHQEFNAAVDNANDRHRDSLVSPLTITLGDEFQGLAASLREAAVIVREMRLRLLMEETECRFVIGAVTLSTPINHERAWNMMGPGLAEARDKLGAKRTDNLYRFSLPGQSTIETLLDALGAALTSLERRWTRTQLHDIVASLNGNSAQEIAHDRRVSAHSVYKARSGGDFATYVILWNAILSALEELDAR